MLDKYKLTYDIKTTPFANGIIEQETTDIFNETIKRVVNTQEEQIKQGLIALGWTPPNHIKPDEGEMKQHIKDILDELESNTINEFFGISLEEYTKEELIVIIRWMGKRMENK